NARERPARSAVDVALARPRLLIPPCDDTRVPFHSGFGERRLRCTPTEHGGEPPAPRRWRRCGLRSKQCRKFTLPLCRERQLCLVVFGDKLAHPRLDMIRQQSAHDRAEVDAEILDLSPIAQRDIAPGAHTALRRHEY